MYTFIRQRQSNTQVLVHPVCRPPFQIFNFRLGRKVYLVVYSIARPENIGIAPLEFCCYHVYKSRYTYFQIGDRHLEFLTSGYVGQYSQ